MPTTRMTGPMRRSLESRLVDLDARIETLDAQREGDDSVEATALLVQLSRERNDVADALRDAMLIDDEPFDTEAIEIGDTITIRDGDGETYSYVLIDPTVRFRARSDWVSLSSPLGATLVGRSTGDRVVVASPAGPMAYVVVDFERASEEAVPSDSSAEARKSHALTLLPSEAFLG
jgi:transcription elongation GreA/GreB family factor